MLRKDKIEVVSVHLELICGFLLGNSHIVVGRRVPLLVDERRYGYTVNVHISCTVVTRVVLVSTISEEGHYILIYAEGLFVAGSGMPPVEAVTSGFAATHVILHGAVNVPFLAVGLCRTAGNEGEVTVEVGKGIVDMECLLHIIRGLSGGIHHEHTDAVVSHRCKQLLISVTGVVL